MAALGKRDFDFWLGEWDVGWGDGSRGTNVVTRLFDGAAILEQFDGRPGIDLRGMSVSAYGEQSGLWRQTWVDSDGNYLPFEGGFAGGVMDLRSTRDGVVYRMQWRDIEQDSLRWLWERATKDDEWETLWELRYARRQPAT